MRLRPTLAAGAAAIAALAAAVVLERFGPLPAADVGRGSEEAFSAGLERREFLGPQKLPHRWTSGRAVFRFHGVPAGPLGVEVGVHNHRGPVRVVAQEGMALGVLDAGVTHVDYRVPAFPGGTFQIELLPDTFVAGDGRRLGALLDRVSLSYERRTVPAPGLLLCLLVPALVAAAAAGVAGLAPGWAALAAVAVVAMQSLALWPCGLHRSGYTTSLAGLWAIGVCLAAAIARWADRRQAGAGAWCFAALLAAVAVQGMATTSPLMVVSDAVFHANKLGEVVQGNWFPTSQTQHARPFRIPYGVSFYALLVPLARAGLDGVLLVRAGAAVSGVLASAALFWLLLPEGGRRAAIAVVLLQLVPITFDVYPYGNFSNVFGQAVTVFFFAWWTGRLGGRWPLGALLLFLGAVSHLSSLIVLATLCPLLLVARRSDPARDKPRLLALAVGLGLAAAYYLNFVGLIRDQLPRLLEGGGQGREALGALHVLALQAREAIGRWGLPAIGLAAAGWALRAVSRPRPERSPFDRDLLAFWAAGALLAVAAVVSPVEVRFLYALAVPLAVSAARGVDALWEWSAWGRLLAVVLLAVQAGLGISGIVQGVVAGYRL